jgi:hypothetical protein
VVEDSIAIIAIQFINQRVGNKNNNNNNNEKKKKKKKKKN